MSLNLPCLQSDVQVNQMPYRLELNRYTQCPLEEVNEMYEDPRYSLLIDYTEPSLNLKEWDV